MHISARLAAALVLTALGTVAAPAPLDTILYGAAYYAEYMPADRLDKDVELMQKAGLTVVRVGESTWSTWEPRDGQFEFDWMQRILDRMHAAGIRVILGTPTYSIPTWLHRKYPDVVVTHNEPAPPLGSPYSPTYSSSATPGFYGPRQNYDFLHPEFRRHAERVIRAIMGRFAKHPAVIGFQIDNETFPTGAVTQYTHRAFVERLKEKFGTTAAMNRAWGLVFWGQLVDTWEDLPVRNGILNPGWKLEWERFQHDIVTDYLAWQAKIVREYARPDQFVTHDFSGGAHTNIDQWAIAKHLDVVAENPYFETQNRFNGRSIWFTGDVGRSLKGTNYLVTETNAQAIGWDARTQYPPYPGQVRQAVYTHLAAGANAVMYWHWASLHYGQETYWRGVLGHDLEPNRVYEEVASTAAELKKVGPRLVNARKDNKVAILFSADSANAISYMPFADRVNYNSVLDQMYGALYDLNIEPDFVQAVPGATLAPYRVLLVPPLYSASDEVLKQISDYVGSGGHVVMAFKSGFTNEHSTVRPVVAPGPLREAAGVHYREFTSLAEPVPLTPAPFGLGDAAKASVWSEFLVPDTAEVVASLAHSVWKHAAITRNKFGKGTLTYEGAVLTPELQRELIRDALGRAGLLGADQKLPAAVRVRHARDSKGRPLHYFFNFSAEPHSLDYSYRQGTDLLTGTSVLQGKPLTIPAWGVVIAAE